VIRTIRLPLADVYEANTLLTIDDERGWPGDVKRREPQTMIDTVALDHQALWIDEDREGKAVPAVIIGHFLGTLTDDHQYLSP
jgi:hypothetical protein